MAGTRPIDGSIALDVTADTDGLRRKLDATLKKNFTAQVSGNFQITQLRENIKQTAAGKSIKVNVDGNFSIMQLRANIKQAAAGKSIDVNVGGNFSIMQLRANIKETTAGKDLSVGVDLRVNSSSFKGVVAAAKKAEADITQAVVEGNVKRDIAVAGSKAKVAAIQEKYLGIGINIEESYTKAVGLEEQKRKTLREKGRLDDERSLNASFRRASEAQKKSSNLIKEMLAREKIASTKSQQDLANQLARDDSQTANRKSLINERLNSSLVRQADVAQRRMSESAARARTKLQQQADKPILQSILLNTDRLNASLADFDRGISRVLGTSLKAFSIWSAGVTALTGAAAGAAIVSFARLEAATARASAVFAGGAYADALQAGTATTRTFGDTVTAVSAQVESASKRIALQTLFNPTEVAQGFQAAAQAGLSFGDAVDSLLPVTQFAQNELLDVNAAVELLTGGLTSSGQKGGKALKRLADEFTFVGNASNATAKQVADAFSNQSASAFRSYGQEAEQALNVINLFGKVNLRGLEAGTSASILIRDINRAAFTKAPQAFKKYGIALEDADGKAVPFARTLGQLGTLLSETKTQKGTGAYVRLRKELGLVEKSSAGLIRLLPQINKLGVAGLERQVAAIKNATGSVARQAGPIQKTIQFQFQQTLENIQNLFSSFGKGSRDELIQAFDAFNGNDGILTKLTPQVDRLGKRFGDLVGQFAKFTQSPEAASGARILIDAIRITLNGVRDTFRAFSEAFTGAKSSQSTFVSITKSIREFAQVSATVLPKVADVIGRIFRILISNRNLFGDFARLAVGVFILRRAYTLLLKPIIEVGRALTRARVALIAYSAAETIGPVKTALVFVATRLGIISTEANIAAASIARLTAAQMANSTVGATTGALGAAQVAGMRTNTAAAGATALGAAGRQPYLIGPAIEAAVAPSASLALNLSKIVAGFGKFALITTAVIIAAGAIKGFADEIRKIIDEDPQLQRDLAQISDALRSIATFAGLVTKAFFAIGVEIGKFLARAIAALLGFGRLGTQIQRAFDSLQARVIGAAINIGANIGQGIARGVRNAYGDVKQAVTDLGDQALDAIKRRLQIKSPSQLFENVVGRQISAGVAVGITKNTGLVKASMGDLARSITAIDVTGSLGYRATRQELARLEAAQPGIQRSITRQTELVNGLRTALDAVRNAQLLGTKAFTDAAFENDQAQKRLQLQRIDALAIPGTTDETQAIKDIDAQIAKLQTTAARADLVQALQLDPLKKKLDETFNPIKELSFNDIVTQFASLNEAYSKQNGVLSEFQFISSSVNDVVGEASKRFADLDAKAAAAKATADKLAKSIKGVGDAAVVAAPQVQAVADASSNLPDVELFTTNVGKLIQAANTRGPASERARAILGIGSSAEAADLAVQDLTKSLGPSQKAFGELAGQGGKQLDILTVKLSVAQDRLKKAQAAYQDHNGAIKALANLGESVTSDSPQERAIKRAAASVKDLQKQISGGDFAFEITPSLEPQAVRLVESQVAQLQVKREAIIALGLPKNQTDLLVGAVNAQIVHLRSFVKQNPITIGVQIAGTNLAGQGAETTNATIARNRSSIEKALRDPSMVGALSKAQKALYDKVRANVEVPGANPFTGLSNPLDNGAIQKSLDEAFSSAKATVTAPKSIVGDFSKYATDVANGIAAGVTTSKGILVKAGVDLAAPMDKAYTDYWQIASPSQVMARYGGFLTQGIAVGIAGAEPAAIAQATTTARNVINALKTSALATVFPVYREFDAIGKTAAKLLANGEPDAMLSGGRIMGGFLNGLKQGFGSPAVIGSVAWYLNVFIPQWIKDNKGPVSYDATILVPAGQAVMQGFGKGLRDGFSQIQGFVREVGPSLGEYITGDAFSGRTATIMADIAVGKKPDIEGMFGDLRPDMIPGFDFGAFSGPLDPKLSFLHPTESLADTTRMAQQLASLFNLQVTALRDNHSRFTASGNISDHAMGIAADLSNTTGGGDSVSSNTPEMGALAAALKPLFGRITKQVIYQNRDINQGFPVAGHQNHVHLAFKAAADFAADSGRFGKALEVPKLQGAAQGPVQTGAVPGVPRDVADALTIAAARYQLPRALMFALAKQESGFRKDVVSFDGGYGLTQLTSQGLVDAADAIGGRLNPQANALVGAKYLHDLIAQLGSKQLGLSAYNSGPGGGERSGRVDVPSYVASVLRFEEEFKKIFGGFREHGGPVTPGKAYVVGERRPELFVPKVAGSIAPRVPSAGAGTLPVKGGSMPQGNDNRRYYEIHTPATDPAAVLAHIEARDRDNLIGVNAG